jgi:PPOX class probable F420-dependent enzyme
MPMAHKQTLISVRIQEKLEASRVARMATIDTGRGPHLVPICFTYDGSFFYSAIDRKPKRVAPNRLARLKNIRKSPRVALLVDQYDEDWKTLWYVLVRGKAIVVSDPTERSRALRRLKAKYPQYRSGMLPRDTLVLRIIPLRVTAWGKI